MYITELQEDLQNLIEIEKIDEAFGIKDFKKQQNTSTEETVAVDYSLDIRLKKGKFLYFPIFFFNLPDIF